VADLDSCVGYGACIDVCPVSLYDWADTPVHPLSDKKADLAREQNCIKYLTCQIQCPIAAILITPEDHCSITFIL
jgi:NAD-dependent dihydropyrimidine dehydrogenase PreA subunit